MCALNPKRFDNSYLQNVANRTLLVFEYYFEHKDEKNVILITNQNTILKLFEQKQKLQKRRFEVEGIHSLSSPLLFSSGDTDDVVAHGKSLWSGKREEREEKSGALGVDDNGDVGAVAAAAADDDVDRRRKQQEDVAVSFSSFFPPIPLVFFVVFRPENQ